MVSSLRLTQDTTIVKSGECASAQKELQTASCWRTTEGGEQRDRPRGDSSEMYNNPYIPLKPD
jgi:hypothetical protein